MFDAKWVLFTLSSSLSISSTISASKAFSFSLNMNLVDWSMVGVDVVVVVK